MSQKLQVFVSATSKDLRTYRNMVAAWLREQGHQPVVQDEFAVQPDFVTIAAMLRDQLTPCDAIICLIGDYYGCEPIHFPEGEARRSYTQLEYELARQFKRPVHLFFTTASTPLDATPTQSVEHAELQQRVSATLARTQQHLVCLRFGGAVAAAARRCPFPGHGWPTQQSAVCQPRLAVQGPRPLSGATADSADAPTDPCGGRHLPAGHSRPGRRGQDAHGHRIRLLQRLRLHRPALLPRHKRTSQARSASDGAFRPCYSQVPSLALRACVTLFLAGVIRQRQCAGQPAQQPGPPERSPAPESARTGRQGGSSPAGRRAALVGATSGLVVDPGQCR